MADSAASSGSEDSTHSQKDLKDSISPQDISPHVDPPLLTPHIPARASANTDFLQLIKHLEESRLLADSRRRQEDEDRRREEGSRRRQEEEERRKADDARRREDNERFMALVQMLSPSITGRTEAVPDQHLPSPPYSSAPHSTLSPLAPVYDPSPPTFAATSPAIAATVTARALSAETAPAIQPVTTVTVMDTSSATAAISTVPAATLPAVTASVTSPITMTATPRPAIEPPTGKPVAQCPSHLQADASFQAFRQWRQRWEDFSVMIDLQRLPREKQHIQLRMSLSQEVQKTLEHTLGIAPNTQLTVEKVLDELQSHFKNKRNEVLRRREVLRCKQAPGETSQIIMSA